MSFNVPLFYDLDLLAGGIKCPVCWNPQTHPHTLIIGTTGSGKTYFEKIMAAKISKHIPESRLWVLDYKMVDFAFLSELYFPYDKYEDGLLHFHAEFRSRLNGSSDRRPIFCLLEEYGAFITACDKKKAEEMKAIVAEILFLGRSLSVFIVCGLQRAEASYFQSGARDQFSQILALGNISATQKEMILPDHKAQMTLNCGRGQGYLLQDGKSLRRVQVPAVKDNLKLCVAIRQIATV